MTITPFLALQLGNKKDAILARQRARRVASLLSFDAMEQACIAAGAFFVACQALVHFGKARLCFQIENNQLHVFADNPGATANAASPPAQRIAGLFPDNDANALFRLVKPLPIRQTPAEDLDMAWLVQMLEDAGSYGIFEEVVKQNQEVLALLHELRLFRGQSARAEEKPANPHAA